MGRQTGPSCKLCRREDNKLFLKGEKCYTAKCPFSKRSYAPGQHGKSPKRLSEFGIRLREKQKARRIYGLSERQFSNYFEKASKMKGATGTKLLELLERRLDNVTFRMTAAASRTAGRQMVRHGHVLVNGRKVNIPSFCVSLNDIISINEKSKETVKKGIEKMGERNAPAWLTFDAEKLEGKIVSIPQREDIDALIEEHLIVEYYSR